MAKKSKSTKGESKSDPRAEALERLKYHSRYMAENEHTSFAGKVAGIECTAVAIYDAKAGAFRFGIDNPEHSTGPCESLQKACVAFAACFDKPFSDSTGRAFKAGLEEHGYNYQSNLGTRAPRSDGSGAGVKAGRKPTKASVRVSMQALAYRALQRLIAVGQVPDLSALVADTAEHLDTHDEDRREAGDFKAALEAENTERFNLAVAKYEAKVERLKAEAQAERDAKALERARKSDERAPNGPRVDRMRLVLMLRTFGKSNTEIEAQLREMTGADDNEVAQAFADANGDE